MLALNTLHEPPYTSPKNNSKRNTGETTTDQENGHQSPSVQLQQADDDTEEEKEGRVDPLEEEKHQVMELNNYKDEPMLLDN